MYKRILTAAATVLLLCGTLAVAGYIGSTPNVRFTVQGAQGSKGTGKLDLSRTWNVVRGKVRSNSPVKFTVILPRVGKWRVYIQTPGGLGYTATVDDRTPIRGGRRAVEYTTNVARAGVGNGGTASITVTSLQSMNGYATIKAHCSFYN